MKKNPLLSRLTALVALLAGTPAVAQESPATPGPSLGTATISGRVKNAATGNYLNNARVSVRGTDRVVFTDAFGTFHLIDVRSGPLVLEAFYTDLDAQQLPVKVAAGETLQIDIALTSRARYGQASDVLQLSPFLVSSDKETDAQAIATNEQRFAPNIKNVMATDSLGDILGSNVGEFLKFIPGITSTFGDTPDASGVSIRGLGGNLSSFTTDGAPMASAQAGGTGGRELNVNNLALNNYSRIELTKVPTPSSPADSLSGSINLVSKSAFERSSALLRYSVNVVANSEAATLDKRPNTHRDRNQHRIFPGFSFDYTLPIGKDFGIVVTGLLSKKFHAIHSGANAYSTGGTSTGASLRQPFLQSFTVRDGPLDQERTSFGLKADWRVAPRAVLSADLRRSTVTKSNDAEQLTPSAGSNGTPTPATGTALTFGPTFTRGATGRGSVALVGGSNFTDGAITSAGLRYRFDDGRWRVEAGFNYSFSWAGRRNQSERSFGGLDATLTPAVRVNFDGITPAHPGSVTAFDVNDRPVDLFDPENYRITGARDTPYHTTDSFSHTTVTLQRRLQLFPFPSSLQAGGTQRVQKRDTRLQSLAWTYAGPDGNPATFESATPYRMQVYRGQDPGFGFPRDMPWISSHRAWEAYMANPILFTKTPAQVVAEEAYRMTNSEFIKETVSSAYLQAEAALFANRLKVLTGVRFEKTAGEGEGSLSDPNAVFERRPDGTFVRNAAGARIRKPAAGAAGSMEELRLVQQERAARSSRDYDGYYPSLHLTYEIRENLLVRAAYAKTYGRPNFADIIPRTTISERDLTEDQIAADPDILRGTLTVRNPALRPWTADNYDLSVEYYTRQGGLFSAGVFRKDISDFFGTVVKPATREDLELLGFDDEYLGWNISSKFNAGDARVSGVELQLRHSLRGLGRWGGYFTLFANGTKLRLEGNPYASFTSFIPESANWGFSFNRKQLSLTARWNYRGLNRLTAQSAFGPDAYQYWKARTMLDLNLAWQFTRRLSLSGSVNNLLNVPQTLLVYGSETPGYARQVRQANFGVQFALGLQGTF